MDKVYPQVVTFGETMVLMTPLYTKGIEYNHEFSKSFGGAESNFAIALARLGHQIGWFSLLGKDPFGRYILKAIRGEGVDVSRTALTENGPTGFMLRETVAEKTSVYYYRSGSAASRLSPEDLDEDYIRNAKILHITGITCAISESARNTVYESIRIAKKHGVKISFDPNLRLKLWTLEEAREVLLPLAEKADYFLPGLDELKLLFDTNDEVMVFSKLKELKAVSIVKGGSDETLLVENGAVTSLPYVSVEKVVDPIGAGDGFCAGFVAGLLKGLSHQESVQLANMVGALVVQSEGDWEGLPTWDEVQALMNQEVHIER
ncbi:sugar kinase [Lederbergia wuyishanensis]|uniref:2-dehydro-3-deoxygluconokinase n=1 Tax=Lederbergia wuyishanensis TaxID=1347903 RepID=A0ABU0D1Z7_9BACI|nr:sugar kinase [Lederbergia wuyishanensis]MCJ8007035.1 sugar kinase [Lederbergia wuyishanensis]MDQ0342420.1 2-dehydro-3-deoxygluconokinase [Lederbergia wuyishanensis]